MICQILKMFIIVFPTVVGQESWRATKYEIHYLNTAASISEHALFRSLMITVCPAASSVRCSVFNPFIFFIFMLTV